ncbi:MAG: MATE family efflux transporter [Chitinophagaceae bacterium]|nr:MAG: MATE family efflux transporter [Chitinophagaceae bacterium]
MFFTKTHKDISKLAAPIIFGELAQMSLHLIDAAMIGAVSYKHLSATSLVINFINIPFIFGIGMTIAVAQLVSLASGKYDKPLVSHYLFNGFIICLITGILISTGLYFSAPLLTHLGQDKEVVALAQPFLKLMSISILPMMLFMTLKQFADGLQFTKVPMILSIAALPLNVFINWLLIYGNWGFPRLELVGAGYGTLISRTFICFALMLVILYHPIFKKYMAIWRNQWNLKTHSLRQVLKIGIPSSFQIGMEAGAFAVSGIIIGTISAQAQAAHQIALSCASFTYMVIMGLSQAGSIKVSYAYATYNWPKIKEYGASTLHIGLIYSLISCTCFIVFRNFLPFLFNDDATVISMAATLLLFAGIFQISDAVQAVSSGLLRGIKDVNIPTGLIAVAYWIIGIPLGLLLSFQFNLGAIGIWLGLIAGLTTSAILLSIRFFNRKEMKTLKLPR